MGYDFAISAEDVVFTHARAFSLHPEFRLVGGVDPDPALCTAFVERYGGVAGGDLAEILARTRPDVVVVAAPTPLHSVLVREVLELAKPRTILCEKPLADDFQDAQDMVRLCRERDCRLYVNYLRRVAPGVREVKRRLSRGEIQSPIKGVCWYSKGLLHNGSHFANLLEYWLGPIARFDLLATGRLYDGVDPEPDVRITFAQGDVTFLAAREENYSLYEVDLVSPNGRLRYPQSGDQIIWQPAKKDPLIPGYTVLAAPGEAIPSGADVMQWHVADELAAAMNGRPTPLCTGSEALVTLEWLSRIKAAIS